MHITVEADDPREVQRGVAELSRNFTVQHPPLVDNPGDAGIAKTTVAASLKSRVGTDVSTDTDETRALYRERAHLVAVLAAHYPARLAYNDESEPELAVLYVHTEAGQVTWHLHPDDLDLFGHVPWADGDTSLFTTFDGHDKAEALARLRHLTETEAVQ